jgi:2-polyprenyl-3-methyl-5-hydroxy-6-metoxy-1,4-benzoquinol methylase
MEQTHIEKCPICGNIEKKKIFTCTDHYATGEVFDLFSCNSCGFMFTQDFPVEAEIGRYYDTKDYISHSDTNEGFVNKIYHIVRKRMLRKKALLVKAHTRSSSSWLLDIGCGTGYFLKEMSNHGFSVRGIEKNKEAREFAHRHLGVSSYEPEKMEEFDEYSFGTITLWHSLEHLEQLNETLKRINKLLVENGTVFVAVPNANSADADIYKEFWAAYDLPRHLWHFTPETMKLLAQKHGFGVDAMYPMPFDAFYVSMLSEKYKKNKLHFLAGFFVGLKCYFKTLNKPEKSSSIIYVLKKSEVLNFHV